MGAACPDGQVTNGGDSRIAPTTVAVDMARRVGISWRHARAGYDRDDQQ